MARMLHKYVLVIFCCLLHLGNQEKLDNNVPKLSGNDNDVTKSTTIYDYHTRMTAYKDLVGSGCYIEFIKNGEPTLSQRIREFPLKKLPNKLYITEEKLSKRRIWDLAGSRIWEFCRGFPTYLIQEVNIDLNDVNTDNDIIKSRLRRRRSTRHYFVGRLRGQTQSQYLNFGHSNNSSGKAEAESTYGTSRATVVGTNGMGQAQSQSSTYDCDECYRPIKTSEYVPNGRSENHVGSEDRGRTREPGELTSGILGVHSVRPTSHFGPGTLERPQKPSINYPIQPGHSGREDGLYSGRISPGQPGVGTPGTLGIQELPGNGYSQVPDRSRYPVSFPGRPEEGVIYPGLSKPYAPGTVEPSKPNGAYPGIHGGEKYPLGPPGVAIPSAPDQRYPTIPDRGEREFHPGSVSTLRPGSAVTGNTRLDERPLIPSISEQKYPDRDFIGKQTGPNIPRYPIGSNDQNLRKPEYPVVPPPGVTSPPLINYPSRQSPSYPGTTFPDGYPGLGHNKIPTVVSQGAYPGIYDKTQEYPGGTFIPSSDMSGKPGRFGGDITGDHHSAAHTGRFSGQFSGVFDLNGQRIPQSPSSDLERGRPPWSDATQYPGYYPTTDQRIPTVPIGPPNISPLESGKQERPHFQGRYPGVYDHDPGYLMPKEPLGPSRQPQYQHGQGQYQPGVESWQLPPSGGQRPYQPGSSTGQGLYQGRYIPTASTGVPGGSIGQENYPPYQPGISAEGGVVTGHGQYKPETSSGLGQIRPGQITDQGISQPIGSIAGHGTYTDSGSNGQVQYPHYAGRGQDKYGPRTGIREDQYTPGAVAGQGQYPPGASSVPEQNVPTGTGHEQYTPGVSTRPGQYTPAVGVGQEQYLPGAGNGYVHPSMTKPPGQLTPVAGNQQGQYTPVAGAGEGPGAGNGHIQYTPGAITRPGQLPPGAGTQQGQLQPGAGTQQGQYAPVSGTGPGQYAPRTENGQPQYTPGAITGPGQFTSGAGNQQGQYTPAAGTGQRQYSPGTSTGQGKFTSGADTQQGQYTPVAGTGQGQFVPRMDNGQFISETGNQQEQYPPAAGSGQRQFAPGTGTGHARYTPGTGSGQSTSVAGIQQGQYIPGAATGPAGNGQQGGIGDQGGTYQPATGVVGKPSETTIEDGDSQAQTSVKQINNETQASAQAQGKFESGSAQSQVSGTYSGTGSFSASAGSDDGKRGALTQVSGGKQGATSSAQGRGGRGKSQAQMQLFSDTGKILSTAQSGGPSHSSQTQVQGGEEGGMANAQSNGSGRTSSQAQIGFSPYKKPDNEVDSQTNFFLGGGTASAQGGFAFGQSQSQIQGKFRYGIKYTGGAQAQSGNGTNKNFSFIPFEPTMQIKPISLIPQTLTKNEETNLPVRVNRNISSPDTVRNKNELPPVTTEVNVDEDQSTAEPPTDGADSAEYDYEDNETDNPTTNKVITQTRDGQTQHIILPHMRNLDAKVVQTPFDDYSERVFQPGDTFQPGELIPGTSGYRIPMGFRAKVKSMASPSETYALGRNSQAQTVTITPGKGKIIYQKPRSTSKDYYNGYHSSYNYKPYQNYFRSGESAIPNFLSISKSETGYENPITGRRVSSTHFTQSSTCGLITNTCIFRKSQRICLPNVMRNSDGSVRVC